MKKHRSSFKQRPVLIIGKADLTDFVVLPVLRVTIKQNLDEKYDIELQPASFPKANLTDISYVRTHKQTIINKADLVKEVVDFKKEYNKTYIHIINKVKQFQNEMFISL